MRDVTRLVVILVGDEDQFVKDNVSGMAATYSILEHGIAFHYPEAGYTVIHPWNQIQVYSIITDLNAYEETSKGNKNINWQMELPFET